MLANSLPNKSPGRPPALNGFGAHLSNSQTITKVKASEVPTTHMLVQFKEVYKDVDALERKTMLNKSSDTVISKPIGKVSLSSDIPAKVLKYRESLKSLGEDSKSPSSLASSFLLPKVYPLNQPTGFDSKRNMLGRSDVSCQNDLNLSKLRLDGLSEYQKWSSDEVEPFLKVVLLSSDLLSIFLKCIFSRNYVRQ